MFKSKPQDTPTDPPRTVADYPEYIDATQDVTRIEKHVEALRAEISTIERQQREPFDLTAAVADMVAGEEDVEDGGGLAVGTVVDVERLRLLRQQQRVAREALRVAQRQQSRVRERCAHQLAASRLPEKMRLLQQTADTAWIAHLAFRELEADRAQTATDSMEPALFSHPYFHRAGVRLDLIPAMIAGMIETFPELRDPRKDTAR